MGGTERVTDILSSELQKGNKHQCFLAYFEDISPSLTQTYFKEYILNPGKIIHSSYHL